LDFREIENGLRLIFRAGSPFYFEDRPLFLPGVGLKLGSILQPSLVEVTESSGGRTDIQAVFLGGFGYDGARPDDASRGNVLARQDDASRT
jgi:hypothetical protein